MSKTTVTQAASSQLLIFLTSNLLFRIVGVLLFFISSYAVAQFKSTLQLGYIFDSNVFGNFAEIPDSYLMANLILDNNTDWDYSSLDLSYDGTLSSYSTYSEEDNWAHNLSASFEIQLSRVGDDTDDSPSTLQFPVDSLETHLTLTGSVSRTVPHAGGFAAYQNFITSGLAILRQPFGQHVVLRIAYEINYTGYDYVNSLSNFENVGMANLAFNINRYFVSYIGGSYGDKKYFGVDTASAMVQNLIKMHSNNRYNGHGNGRGRGNNNQSGGSSPTTVNTYVLDSPSATQATSGAGFNWQFEQWKAGGSILFRKNESGNARYIDYVAKFANFVSLVYDDPYSYHGDEINFEVAKDSLGFGVNVSVGLSLSNKNYDRPAFDTTQATVIANRRHDKFTDFSISLSKRMPMKVVTSGLMLGFEYHYMANSSNDQFYQFTDDVINFKVGVELF